MGSEKHRIIKRGTAALLAGTVLWTNVVAAHGAESAFWTKRREAAHRIQPGRTADADQSSGNLWVAGLPQAGPVSWAVSQSGGVGVGLVHPPPDFKSAVLGFPATNVRSPPWISSLILPYGAIHEMRMAKRGDAPLIIHIQDAHGIEDAQRNMAAMIRGLTERANVSLVGMEGASGAFTADRYRRYSTPAITRGLAESFLKDGLLGGPEYVALTASKPTLLWGIENLDLYQGNVQAFKDSLKGKHAIRKLLAEIRSSNEHRKKKVFSPALRTFTLHATQYTNQEESLGSYARFLLGSLESITGAKIDYPHVRFFLKATDQEHTLDFQAVETERTRLIQTLVQTLSKKDLTLLVQQSARCRTGEISLGGYHQFLRVVCRDNRISTDRFGPLQRYIEYVLLAEKINPPQLLKEVALLEKEVEDRLALTPEQKALVAGGRGVSVLEKLVGQKMSPTDWDLYFSHKKDILAAVNAFSSTTVPEDLLEPSERFCRYATDRNAAMTGRLLAKMKETKSPVAVLVAGGFHTAGLTRLLHEKDASYVVVTPRITRLPSENTYLDIFAHDPLPLETLFSGDRISLVAPPALAESTHHVRREILEGTFTLASPALEAFLDGRKGGVDSVDALFRTAQIAAKKLFDIRGVALEMDPLSRAGIYALFRGKIRRAGQEVNAEIFVSAKEKEEVANEFLRQRDLKNQVVKQSDISINGKTYVLALLRSIGHEPRLSIARFKWRDFRETLRAAGEVLLLNHAPSLLTGVFVVLVLVLSFLCGPVMFTPFIVAATAYKLPAFLKASARKSLTEAMGSLKQGAPLTFTVEDGHKIQATFHGAHMSEGAQWMAVRMLDKDGDGETPLEFFDLVLLKELVLPNKLGEFRPASILEEGTAVLFDEEKTKDKYQRLTRDPRPALTQALVHAVGTSKTFGPPWTLLLAVLEERLSGKALSEEIHADRLIPTLLTNPALQKTPQGMWLGRFLINHGYAEPLVTELVHRLKSGARVSPPQKMDPGTPSFETEMFLEGLKKLPIDSPLWEDALGLAEDLPQKFKERLLEVVFTEASESPRRMNLLFDWCETKILSDHFNANKNHIEGFLEAVVKSERGVKELAHRTPRFLELLMGLVEARSFFEIEPALKMTNWFLAVSPLIEAHGAAPVGETLRPSLTQILATERSASTFFDTHFLAVLRLARRIGVEPSLCQEDCLRRLASSDSFSDTLINELKSGQMAPHEIESLLGNDPQSIPSSSQVQERVSRVLAVIRGGKGWEPVVDAFNASADPQARVALAKSVEAHFYIAADLLRAVFASQRESVEDLVRLVPSLVQMKAEGFSASLFLKEGALSFLVENLKNLGILLDTELTGAWGSLDQISPVVPLTGNSKRVEVRGYLFPSTLAPPVEESPRPVNATWTNLAVVSQEKPMNPLRRAELLAKFRARQRLLEANDRVLKLFGELAGSPMRRFEAERALDLVEKMYESFSLLQGQADSPAIPFPSSLESLREHVHQGVAALAPEDPIPGDLQHSFLNLRRPAEDWDQVGTMHEAVNFMHQKGLKLFDEAARAAEVNTMIQVGPVKMAVANVGNRPLMNNGKMANLPILTVARALEKPGIGPQGQYVVRGDYIHGSIPLGIHSVEFSAALAPPAEGGGIRLTYSEWREKEGNVFRLAYVENVLKGLGFHTQVDKGMYLSAILDENHGAENQKQIEKALFLVVRALYSTPDLNLMLDSAINEKRQEFGLDFNAAVEATREEFHGLPEVFLAEECLPFFRNTEVPFNQSLNRAYQSYRERAPERKALRSLLNKRLGECGVPGMPETMAFGQGVIEAYYTEPLLAGLARGEVAMGANGLKRNPLYAPVHDLAKAVLENPEERMRMAAGLRSLGEGVPVFHPLGAVGRLTAVEGQWTLAAGGRLVLRGLKDPDTGRLLYATARRYREEGSREELSVSALAQALGEEGATLSMGEEISAPLRGLMERLLRSAPQAEPMPGEVRRGVGVSAGKGGPVAGMVTFDREYYKNPGVPEKPILVVPYTTPDDFEGIIHAGGVITTSGGGQNHAAITTREAGKAGVVLPGARWTEENGDPRLVIRVESPYAARRGEGGLWISEGMSVREETIAPGTVLLMDGDRGVVSVLVGEERKRMYGDWRDFIEGRLSPEALVANVVRRGNPTTPSEVAVLMESVEFVLFQTLWDKEAEENERTHVFLLLEKALSVFPEAVQRQFFAAKEKQLASLLEKTGEEHTHLVELIGWSSVVRQIESALSQINERYKEVHDLEKKLSLRTFFLDNLILLKETAKKRATELRVPAHARIVEWETRSLTLADLRDVRKVLWEAQRSGVPLTDAAFQRLAEKGKELAKAKRKEIHGKRRTVYALNEVDRDFGKRVGGKFANLGESEKVVRGEGGQVPNGLDVTTDAFETYLVEQGIRGEYKGLVGELDALYEDASMEEGERYFQILEKAHEIRDLIERHPLDPAGVLGVEIMAALDANGLGTMPLMVRSSSVQEDTQGAAFAGAAKTFSNVDRANVLRKVKESWMSFWLPRGVGYRAHQGIKQKEVRPSVIVQEMVKAEVSGVMFTVNPLNGHDEVVISAGYGLGEGLESGLAEGDEYVARKSDGEEISFPVIRKKTQKMVGRADGEGADLVGVAPEEQQRRALSGDEVKRLVRVGTALETHYGYPLNIEYAFEGDMLSVLQVRPITTLRVAAKPLPGTSDILGPFTQPLKRFEGLGRARGLALGVYFLVVGLIEEALFRATLGASGVGLTSLAEGNGWGLLFGVGMGLFLGGEILFRSAARMRVEGIRPEICVEEVKADIAQFRSSFHRSRFFAAFLFNVVYFGVAHLFPGYELWVAGVFHAMWDLRAARKALVHEGPSSGSSGSVEEPLSVNEGEGSMVERQNGVVVSGYLFPLPLKSSFVGSSFEITPGKSPLRILTVESQERRINPARDEILHKKGKARQSLLETNDRILRLFSQRAGTPMRRWEADRAMALVQEMYESYALLKVQKGTSVLTEPSPWVALRHTVTEGLNLLDPDEWIPPDLQRLILLCRRSPDRWERVETVHEAINLMHQEGLNFYDEAARRAEVTTTLEAGRATMAVANVSGFPLVKKGEILNPALRIIARSMQKPGKGPQGRFVVDADSVQGSIALGVHGLEFSVVMAPPEEGGRIRISYSEWRVKEGNTMRLAFVEQVLKKLGFHTEVNNGQYLSAILDKSHGAGDQREIERALFLTVRAIYYTPDLNLMFDSVIGVKRQRVGTTEAEALEATQEEFRGLPDVFIAEEGFPFYLNPDASYPPRLDQAYAVYLSEAPERKALRSLLNKRLEECGLPGMPETMAFGQGVIEAYYTEPLLAGLARGEVAMGANGLKRNPLYAPVHDLAKAVLENPEERMRMAAGLRSLGEGVPVFHPLGAVGRLTAVEGQWTLAAGGRLVLRGLTDPDTGRLLYATARRYREEGSREELSVSALAQALGEEGATLSMGEEISAPLRGLMERLLRSAPQAEPMPGEVRRGVGVSAGKGGPVAGVVTFDREYYKNPGVPEKPILVVPYTTPDDFEGIIHAGGVITTSGGGQNHAAITTREAGKAGVVLPGARWTEENGDPRLVIRVESPYAARRGGKGDCGFRRGCPSERKPLRRARFSSWMAIGGWWRFCPALACGTLKGVGARLSF
jgi:phosphoenolpyruvate synthase/pyruvate phosphate dikinase